MASSAEWLLVLGLLAVPPAAGGMAGATDPPPAVAAPRAVPGDWSTAIQTEVAKRWRVAADHVTLEWGRLPRTLPAADGTAITLEGSGGDGWFAAVLRPVNGEPFALRVRAGVPESVWVAARSLASGEWLASADLRAQTRVHWGAPGTPRPAPEPGSQVRRAIAAGAIVAWPAVALPPVIRAGEPVRMEWKNGAVTVAVIG